MIFLELDSSICANWCRVFVGRGLGQVQAALVLLPPTSLPRPARRRPPPHLLRHQFFSQSFFLQIFTFSPASSITHKKQVLSNYSCCQRRCFMSPGLLCSEAPCHFWCPSRYFVGSCPDLNKKTSISNMVTITHSVISSRNNHTSKLLMTTFSKTLTNAMRLPFEHQIQTSGRGC